MSKLTTINCSTDLCQSFLALQTELLDQLKRTAYRLIRSSGLDESGFHLNQCSLARYMNVDLFSFAAGTSDLELVYDAHISGRFYRVQATASCFRGSIDVDAMLFCRKEEYWLCYACGDGSWMPGPGVAYFDELEAD